MKKRLHKPLLACLSCKGAKVAADIRGVVLGLCKVCRGTGIIQAKKAASKNLRGFHGKIRT